MTDFIDDYRRRVKKRLSRHEKQPALEIAEALCMPSFHPETLLRACRHEDKTVFRFVTLTENLWYSESPTVGRQQEIAEAPLEATQRFWQAIADLNPPSIQVEESLGADGMDISVTHSCGDTTTSFETWSPDQTSPDGRFVKLLYDLAWALLKDQASIERLEHLHGYLSLALPARFVPGEVATLRLFGGLTSYHIDELRRVFESTPTETPLVIDMTNLDGMGTILYPTFVEFSRRHPCIGWAVSTAARKHLERMQLVEPHMFDSTADAVAWVRGQADESSGHA